MAGFDKTRTIITVGDYRSLPAVFLTAVVKETIPALGKGNVEFTYTDPQFEPPKFLFTASWLERLGKSSELAVEAISSLGDHISNVGYYIQVFDDPEAKRFKRLHSHSQLVSALLESRLSISATPIWRYYDWLVKFRWVQEEYRADPDRVENYEQHVKSLEELLTAQHAYQDVFRLLQRAAEQIAVRTKEWESLPNLENLSTSVGSDHVPVFYSYCHKDEDLRNELEKHLSILQRNKHISQWHDRKIGAGREWEGQISEHLRSAKVILLLISSDFLASDYCYDVELDVALEMHEKGDARVIPVFLRQCDWQGSRFSKLLGLPEDAVPVTSCSNLDEAFTSIARGIRSVVAELRSQATP